MLHSPQRLDAGAAAAAAAARLRGWLLSEQVQQQQGPHAGGVAGALDADGQARYVYPEITGYFLHWLAEARVPAGLDAARVAAARATDWTLRQFADGAIPLTRSYLVDAAHDWRNDASFFFDLAMLLRGLCAASDARLIAPPLASRGRAWGIGRGCAQRNPLQYNARCAARAISIRGRDACRSCAARRRLRAALLQLLQ